MQTEPQATEWTRERVLAAIEEHGWGYKKASSETGVARSTIRYWLQQQRDFDPEAEPAKWVGIDLLTPWDQNPRQNDGEPVDAVAESIKRYGWGNPILARKSDSVVIAGHTRLKAAKSLGLSKVLVRFMDLDEEQSKALALADNRTGELAVWDDDVLLDVLRSFRDTSELEALASMGFDLDDVLHDTTTVREHERIVADRYTAKVEAPVYEPKQEEQPPLDSVYDTSKSDAMRDAILAADVDDDVRDFLLAAAGRHTLFRYDRIAEYYAHAPADIQRLMEDSALVIIDFNRAIELGFVRMAASIADAYEADENEADHAEE